MTCKLDTYLTLLINSIFSPSYEQSGPVPIDTASFDSQVVQLWFVQMHHNYHHSTSTSSSPCEQHLCKHRSRNPEKKVMFNDCLCDT